KDKASPTLAELVLLMTDEELIRKYGSRGVRKSDIFPGAFESIGMIYPHGEERIMSIQAARIYNLQGEVIGAIQTTQDITEHIRIQKEQEKLQSQLIQSQKMEAIGTLAGGVAHDFNNILTAIIGYGSIMKMKVQKDDPLQSLIEHILTSSERAAHLTQGLLAFSRKQVINPKPVEINSIVRNVEKLLMRVIGEDIDFSTRLAREDLIVMADAGQMEQVLMNLATNARDAMPEGGVFTISTQEAVLTEDFINAHGYGKPGENALISVSDTGIGMDEQTRAKIFDPFFTTKELGKGTGLGMAIVYGIVKQHNGNINVYSEPGKGTTFRIHLPLIATQTEAFPTEPSAQPRGGIETILLAEDDQMVRDLSASILSDFGYRVIGAVDGQDAIERFSKHADEIDLIILDVIMPKKTGREVYDVVRSKKPKTPVLFISGYTADILHKKGVFEEGIQFISKPVSPFDLLRKIRDLLDKR
ncbi:MAG: ATP-binding protein, partial [Syntrophales bacterium]|nr:ATP-binding protein [Syntrophales bacterium]